MSRALWRRIRDARRVAKVNPLLGYALERSALAVINPGVQKFEHNLENTITVLESLKDELTDALKMLDTEDAKEFAQFFEDAAEAEEEELRQMLKKVSTVAGFKDYLQKFKDAFKPVKKELEKAEESGMSPSYQMDDSSMDEFVEGKREWTDPGHYIEQEAKQNAEFFSGVEKVLDEMESARKKPSKKLVQDLLKKVDVLIKKGKNFTQGVREHLIEPLKKPDVSESGLDEKKPAEEGAKMSPEKLDSTVTYYADLLKDHSGDEKSTVKYLKELFHAVKPLLHEDRAELAAARLRAASPLIRCAHARPELRRHLLPVIYKLTGR